MNRLIRRCEVIVDVRDKRLYTRESMQYEEYYTNQHGRFPFEGRLNELADKLSSALSPSKHRQQKEGKDFEALTDISKSGNIDAGWTDTESNA